MKKQIQKVSSAASEKKKPLSDARAARIILWAGFVCALLYLIYLGREILIGADFFEILVGCVALILITMAIAIRNMGGRILQRILAFGLCFFLLTFTAFQIWVLSAYRSHPKSEDGRYVILVMGCRVNGWEPSKTLKYRLDASLELLNADPNAVCVVSGGQGSNESVAEGQVMKKYLTDRGISPDRIYVEDQASNTEENLKFSYEVIKENGLSDLPVVTVSSAYHIPRIALICAVYSYGQVNGYGSYSVNAYTWIAETVREYMALCRTAVGSLFTVTGGAS